MNNLSNLAVETLKNGDFTLVLVKDIVRFTTKERGVAPLIKLIDEKFDCAGFCVADRVVGKAGALLYAYLNVGEVYTFVLSESALEIFKAFNIKVFYDKLVPHIINRKGDGICPMEQAVKDTSNPKTALSLIKSKLMQLKLQV